MNGQRETISNPAQDGVVSIWKKYLKWLKKIKMGKQSGEVAVVVIIHKKDLSHYENISLLQCLKVFHKWPIHIAKPFSLDISDFKLNNNKISLENFPDSCFSNIGEYSRLLLTTSFYKRFLNYKYILIYHGLRNSAAWKTMAAL